MLLCIAIHSDTFQSVAKLKLCSLCVGKHIEKLSCHAEYEHHKDQSTFDVEVVKDKKIMKVKVDPTSGKVISSVEDKDDEHKKHDKHHKADKRDKVD